MTVQLSEFYPYLAPSFPGAPTPALNMAIIQAAQEFCEETNIWLQLLDPIDIVSLQYEYSLSVPSGMEAYADLIGVESVKYKQDGEDEDQFVSLKPLSEIQVDREARDGAVSAGWKYEEEPAPGYYYIDPATPGILSLYPTPDTASAEGLLVRAILTPLDTATVLPDFLKQKWQRAIVYGAKEFLYSITSQPWADPNLEMRAKIDFSNEKVRAKYHAITGEVTMNTMVRMRGSSWL